MCPRGGWLCPWAEGTETLVRALVIHVYNELTSYNLMYGSSKCADLLLLGGRVVRPIRCRCNEVELRTYVAAA